MIPIIFLLGLFVGSFLNVVIDRIPREEKLSGRSHCDSCKKTLSFFDLIPVLSFLFLKARCRYCKTRLSFQYPIIEILTGFAFVATFHLLPEIGIMNQDARIKDFGELFYWLFIMSTFIALFITDLKYGILPDKLIIPAVVVSFLYFLLYTPYLIPHHYYYNNWMHKSRFNRRF